MHLVHAAAVKNLKSAAAASPAKYRALFRKRPLRFSSIAPWILFALGLFIRVQYVSTAIIETPFVKDARQYYIYGYNLAHHRTFSSQFSVPSPRPDSLRSPGYPLLIALSFMLGGDNLAYPLVIGAQVILGSLTVLLTYFTALLLLPLWAASTAAVLVAVSPHLVVMNGYLLTETLFGFLFLSALFCFLTGLKKTRPWLLAFSGILFGYAYLVNETTIFIPYIFAAILGYYLKSGKMRSWEKKLAGSVVIFVLFFSIFPAVWQLRNAIGLGAGAPTGRQRALATLSHGAYPGFIYKSQKFKYFPHLEDPMQPAFSASFKNFVEILSERFRARPLRYLSWYLVEKPYYFWSWGMLQGKDIYIYRVKDSLYQRSLLAYSSKILMEYFHYALLIAALAGIPMVFMRNNKIPLGEGELIALFFVIICLYYTFVYAVFAPWPRYSIPLRPILYLWALWSANVFVGLLSARRQKIDSSGRVKKGGESGSTLN
jgi:4-amino-4-deoxy-L-arabinose transferase-like glycosyltransferase